MSLHFSKPLIILGAGGHAKVIYDVLTQLEAEVIGCVSPDLEVGSKFCNTRILGGDKVIQNFHKDEILLVNGIGSLPYKQKRWEIALKMRNDGYKFATIIHPKAIIATEVELCEGVQIMAGVVIQAGSKISQDTIINTGVLIDHDCTIRQNCHLAPGSSLCGGVEIGSNTHIGAGAILTEYISIGSNCKIGAGSLIYKSVADNVSLKQVNELKIGPK